DPKMAPSLVVSDTGLSQIGGRFGLLRTLNTASATAHTAQASRKGTNFMGPESVSTQARAYGPPTPVATAMSARKIQSHKGSACFEGDGLSISPRLEPAR